MSFWRKIVTAFNGITEREQPFAIACKGFSRAEMALLSQFAKPKPLTPAGVNGAWEAVLQKSPKATISVFVRRGLIEKAPIETQALRLTVKVTCPPFMYQRQVESFGNVALTVLGSKRLTERRLRVWRRQPLAA